MTSILLAIALHGPICDDGSFPYDANGRPNFQCKIDGCGPADRVCWPDALAGCYDDAGEENGVCLLATESCEGIVPCFGMWLACYGTWVCEIPGVLGCKQGSCTENEDQADSSN
jgi:hypothetical protein